MTLAGFAVVALLAQSTTPGVVAQTPATSSGAEVRGRLLFGDSKAPVVGANVSLRGDETNSIHATTDEAGGFVLRRVPAGEYSLRVIRGTEIWWYFGTGVPKEVTFNVTVATRIELGDVLLATDAVVTGQVLDARGRPLAGATVNAWRLGYFSPGDRFLSYSGWAVSDDRGDFRLIGMNPGTYLVSARETETSAPTYFPGVANARAALGVRVDPVSGAAGISIRLLAPPLARVTGIVVDSQSSPSAQANVRLHSTAEDGAQLGPRGFSTTTDADGRFSIGGIPPGTYDVAVLAKSPTALTDEARPPGFRVGREEAGVMRIAVDGHAIDDVRVQTEPPVQLSGRVTLDGVAIPAEFAREVQVSVDPYARRGSSAPQLGAIFAILNDNGEFDATVVRGRLALRITTPLEDVWMHHVLVDGVDVTDDGFEVGGMDIHDVVLALTSKPSRVSGRIINAQGAAVPNAHIVVFPSDDRRWQLPETRVIKTAASKKDGTFTVTALPPGSYYAAVVPTLVDGEWAEPSNLEKLRATATSFKLSDGERKTLMLTVRR